MIAAIADDALAIVNVTVIDLDGPFALGEQTVLIERGRITGVGPSSLVDVPQAARRLGGHKQFLMPGLCDMHVHVGLPLLEAGIDPINADELYEDAAHELIMYLSHGVTTIRNMAGAPFHRRLASEVEAGLRPGPNLRSVSSMLDGNPPVWPFAVPVTSLADARTEVRRARSEGFEAIKVYNLLSRQAYAWLMAEANAVGLPLVGHVPFDVGVIECLRAGQKSIEHFRGYDIGNNIDPRLQSWIERAGNWLQLDRYALDRYVEATAHSLTWNCPTFTVMKSGIRANSTDVNDVSLDRVPPALAARMTQERSRRGPNTAVEQVLLRSLDVQRGFLRDVSTRTDRLLVGTDAGISDILPGVSVHEELEQFVCAGMSPPEALRCCIEGAARFYGEDLANVRVARGALADLVLLNANPLQHIANVGQVAGVIASGRFFDAAALRELGSAS